MSKEKTIVTVGSFTADGILPNFYERKRPILPITTPIIDYKKKLHSTILIKETNWKDLIKYDRGILAVGIIDFPEKNPEVISMYFPRIMNWISDGIKDEEAYRFGYKLGEKFDQGSSNYILEENLNLLSHLEKRCGLLYSLYFNLVNKKRKDKKSSLERIKIYNTVFPFRIFNKEKIIQGIEEGQMRA